MSRKVFTAGEVLAAADVNSFLMDQAVMSFAGTAARGSAIPTPVEGMTTYREDIDRIESYTGSQWTSPSDLVLIKTQTIGSAVSTSVVADAFSSDYDDYVITVSGGVSAALANLTFQITGVTSGYRYNYFYSDYNNSIQCDGFTNASSLAYVGTAGGSSGLTLRIDVGGPNLPKATTFSSQGGGNLTYVGSLQGRLSNTDQYTGFTIGSGGTTMTGGIIRVFGYRKAL